MELSLHRLGMNAADLLFRRHRLEVKPGENTIDGL